MTQRRDGSGHGSEKPGRELAAYCIGGVLSLLLTGASFALVGAGLLPGSAMLPVLGLLAALQVVVQLRCFMHVGLKGSHRDDLQLILFTALILAVMIAGTLWILYDQHQRMN